MFKRVLLFSIASIIITIGSFSPAYAQKDAAVAATSLQTGTPVLWEPVDIKSRDLFLGPGEGKIAPEMKGMQYLGPQTGGNNLKYRLKDGNGTEWVVKIADESRAEVAAVRLLWALGYRTEVDQIVKTVNIANVGNYKNARFEARPSGVKRGERWSWTGNQFVGTKEFDGLKLMMALVNNWDLKDENNVILHENGKAYYIISDLGSSFGKLAKSSASRSGRSVGKAEDFASESFIKGVDNGMLMLNYRGKADHLMNGIKVENARWLADMLLQLSDKQISDAFRAANYSDEDVQLYTAAVKSRIADLDKATSGAATTKAAETAN